MFKNKKTPVPADIRKRKDVMLWQNLIHRNL